MPWCPVCKEEYKEGVTLCPDCNAELVESLDEIQTKDLTDILFFEEEALANKFVKYLEYSEIEASCRYNEEANNFVVSVEEHNIKKAKKHFNAFYAVEASEALNQELSDLKEAKESLPEKSEDADPFNWDRTKESVLPDEASFYSADGSNAEDTASFDADADADTSDQELKEALEEIVYSSSTYEKKSDKARDLFSTAMVFGFFGIAGVVLIILNLLGVISLFGGVLFYLVGSIMFLGFIVVAVQSLNSYKKTKADAVLEEQLTKSLTEWLEQNYTLETKNEFFAAQAEAFPDMTDEIMYLRMTLDIKSRLVAQFGEIDDAYLDYIIENYCNTAFSQE